MNIVPLLKFQYLLLSSIVIFLFKIVHLSLKCTLSWPGKRKKKWKKHGMRIRVPWWEVYYKPEFFYMLIHFLYNGCPVKWWLCMGNVTEALTSYCDTHFQLLLVTWLHLQSVAEHESQSCPTFHTVPNTDWIFTFGITGRALQTGAMM